MENTTEQLQLNCRNIADDLGQQSETFAYETRDNALDIEFTIGQRGQFLGARLLVAFGGPNIWINTRYDRVEGSWGERCEFRYDDVNDLHGACEELFECMR